jgi:glycosyltransferase involved in cell wall biosynthesis
MRTVFPKLENKIVTIPNFVDLDHFVPPLERRRREVPEIMIAASIWPSKNTVGFIDAVAKLKDKGHKFHISWYGLNTAHLDYIDQCRQKIERFGVADCIELKEKTTKIKERYQDADYFCLPSFYEGTPNVICEAMACGLPVVCSDVCDNSKYVIEGKNGFLFNPKDTDSIVAAFERLFALDDERYLLLSNNSREIAEKKLSKEAFVDSYTKLVE